MFESDSSYSDDASEFETEFTTPEYNYGMEFRERESFSSVSNTTNEVKIWFFLNGVPLHSKSEKSDTTVETKDDGPGLPEPFRIESSVRESIFPTLSLYSSDVKVLCHFASDDVVYSKSVLPFFNDAVTLDGRPLK